MRKNLYLTIAEDSKYPDRNLGSCVWNEKFAWGFRMARIGKGQVEQKGVFIIKELISLKQNQRAPLIIGRNASLNIIRIKNTRYTCGASR